MGVLWRTLREAGKWLCPAILQATQLSAPEKVHISPLNTLTELAGENLPVPLQSPAAPPAPPKAHRRQPGGGGAHGYSGTRRPLRNQPRPACFPGPPGPFFPWAPTTFPSWEGLCSRGCFRKPRGKGAQVPRLNSRPVNVAEKRNDCIILGSAIPTRFQERGTMQFS